MVAACVGPVTAAAFELWGVPTVFPERSRLVAMVKQLETELPSRRDGLALELVDGQLLLLHGDDVLLDGVEVKLSPAPAAVLQALVANPGNVVSRQALLAMLPSGHGRAPSTPSRWRWPGCARPSVPGPCRRWSSAATGWQSRCARDAGFRRNWVREGILEASEGGSRRPLHVPDT